MRIVVAAAFAAMFLSGCVGHSSPAATKAAPPPAPMPVATHGANRFDMTQHGRQMTADDFDAWMKSRGIRIAKGPQTAAIGKPPAKHAPKPAAKPAPKSEAKAEPARGAAAAKRR